ncbi:MAG: TRAP transporter large permease [Oscillospiraceae bacterium]|jgi:C4-dicarboxylate transporter DctM subunit|nr:TRAP transporter large permease [Oscillospiraceae bacterium]
MSIALLFIFFIGLAILSIPISAAIGVGVLASVFSSNIISLSYVVRGMVNNVDSFTMTAIPFFVLAGQIMAKCGISKGLFDVANVFMGRLKGGVMMVTVLACMAFGAISGSAFATVAAIGMIALPELKKQGVSKGAAAALIATSGCLGQMIPPSMGLVVYGGMNNVSIAKLFIAEVIPGIFVGCAFLVYCYYYGKKHNICAGDRRYTTKEKLQTIWNAKWSLLMPIIILGGIYSGMFTPTEAAVVSVVYGFGYGVLKSTLQKRRGQAQDFLIKNTVPMLYDSVITTAGIMFLVGISSGFGKILTLENVPANMSNYVLANVDSKFMVLVMITLILLVLGTFLDGTAINVIVSPILLNIAVQYGIDPVHFGVIFVFVSTLGLLTPPLGANLFVGSQICDTTFEDSVKNIWPWIAVMFAALLFIIFIPGMSMWLPSLMK